MDTISLNNTQSGNRTDDGKGKSMDATVASTVTGVAGVALGVGVKTAMDALNETDSKENKIDNNDHVGVSGAANHSAAEETTTSEVVAEVNPDDVMLEPIVDEPIIDEPIVEVAPANESEASEDVVYNPFSNDTPINAASPYQPQTEDVLIAETHDLVDAICGEPEIAIDITDITPDPDTPDPEGVLLAEIGDNVDDSVIQLDLMA